MGFASHDRPRVVSMALAGSEIVAALGRTETLAAAKRLVSLAPQSLEGSPYPDRVPDRRPDRWPVGCARRPPRAMRCGAAA